MSLRKLEVLTTHGFLWAQCGTALALGAAWFQNCVALLEPLQECATSWGLKLEQLMVSRVWRLQVQSQSAGNVASL